MKHITDEEFLEKKGWIKKKGWKINIDDLPVDELDCIYCEDIKEIASECEYWYHPTHCQSCYDDIDSLLEDQYEEYLDGKRGLINKDTHRYI